jgi:hypothetical protein
VVACRTTATKGGGMTLAEINRMIRAAIRAARKEGAAQESVADHKLAMTEASYLR